MSFLVNIYHSKGEVYNSNGALPYVATESEFTTEDSSVCALFVIHNRKCVSFKGIGTHLHCCIYISVYTFSWSVCECVLIPTPSVPLSHPGFS